MRTENFETQTKATGKGKYDIDLGKILHRKINNCIFGSDVEKRRAILVCLKIHVNEKLFMKYISESQTVGDTRRDMKKYQLVFKHLKTICCANAGRMVRV